MKATNFFGKKLCSHTNKMQKGSIFVHFNLFKYNFSIVFNKIGTSHQRLLPFGESSQIPKFLRIQNKKTAQNVE